jgi:DNA/RNA-binding domain of Phe-tRNA-synthetase-like protein
MEIRIELPGVKLGVVEAGEVRFTLVDEALAKLMDEVCEGKRREFTLESLATAEPTRAVRAMFRAWGVDPSKYRPSSEALLRRVLQGKRTWHLEGRPVLADAQGPFGSPISDSTRSMITDSARAALVVIYAPSTASDASIEAATIRLQDRLARFAGAAAPRAVVSR